MKYFIQAVILVAITSTVSVAQERSETGQPTTPVAEEAQPSLQDQIAQARAEDQTEAYIYNMIDQAVAAGEVKIPDAMMTTDGTIDYVYYLASLFPDQDEPANDDPVALTENTNDSEPAPATLTAERAYIVESGDSLAAIAQKFYGDPELYMRVFNANRDQVSLPWQQGDTLTESALLYYSKHIEIAARGVEIFSAASGNRQDAPTLLRRRRQ